eukprot:6708831-Prorocentrum_lima.AAC.1
MNNNAPKNNNGANYLAPDFYAKKKEKESGIDTSDGEEEPKRGFFKRIKDLSLIHISEPTRLDVI